MTPNVSRLLIKWGVSEIIGDDLVQCKYINMRRKDGVIIQRTELYPKVVREFGFPVRQSRRMGHLKNANTT
jgi:salicylate hydroxylase